MCTCGEGECKEKMLFHTYVYTYGCSREESKRERVTMRQFVDINGPHCVPAQI